MTRRKILTRLGIATLLIAASHSFPPTTLITRAPTIVPPKHMTTDRTQLLIAAGATVTTIAVMGTILSRREDPMAERAAEMLASPPSPSDLGLPEATEFGSFTNRRGVPIHTMKLKSSSTAPPKAMVVCFHGICDHSSRPCYGRVYSALSEAGVDVYAMDHVGHGLSGGERAYIEDFFDWVDDAEDFCKQSIEASGNKAPLFIIGQSMGANVASHVVHRLAKTNHPVRGLVLTSPAFGVDMDLVLRVQDFFGAYLDKAVPKAQLVDAVRPEDLTRTPEEVERFRNDPLVFHGNLKVRTALKIKQGFESMEQKRSDLSCPILILHGTKDHTTSISSALDFFNNVGTPKDQRRFVILKSFFHEVYNEPERERPLDMIVKFISSLGEDLPDADVVSRSTDGEGKMESVIELDLVGSEE